MKVRGEKQNIAGGIRMELRLGEQRRGLYKLEVGQTYIFKNAGHEGWGVSKKPKRGKVIAEYPRYYLVDFGCFRECFLKSTLHEEIGGI